jgi:hypothetical protein
MKVINLRLLNAYPDPRFLKVDPDPHLLSVDMEFFFTDPNLKS